MGFKYAESMNQYKIASCAQKLIEMFQKAIEENKNEKIFPNITMLSALKRQAIRLYKRIA